MVDGLPSCKIEGLLKIFNAVERAILKGKRLTSKNVEKRRSVASGSRPYAKKLVVH